MAQYALPLTLGGDGPARIIVGASNRSIVEALARTSDWPFRTAILAGPPRSGKSLLARWFVEAGMGEAVDDAASVPEDALFHRWNRAQTSGTPLLLVSSVAPGRWTVGLPDLASRLGSALLLEIGAPDDNELAELLAEHAGRRGLALTEGAARWLVPRIERSHDAVEKLIAEIDRLSLERKAPITISLLREALSPSGGDQPRLL